MYHAAWRRDILGLVGCSVHALIVATGLSAACGHVGFDDQSPLPPAGSNSQAAPQACFTAAFPAVAFPDPGVDLAVAATPDGVAVIWAPLAIGDLTGLTLDTQWTLATGPFVVKAGSYSGTGAAYLDNALELAELEAGGNVKFDVASNDLTTLVVDEFGCPSGTTVSKQALLHAGADSVAATGWDNGMTVTGYDSGWNETDEMTVTTAAPVAVTATDGMGTADAYVAWTDGAACDIQDVANASTMGSLQAYTSECTAPRIAAVPAGLAIAFQDSTSVELSVEPFGTIVPMPLASGASSPRLAYDGTRLWFAYLDASGHAVIGQLSNATTPLATQTSFTPAASAFELVAIGSDVWLFTADAVGMTATMFCLP